MADMKNRKHFKDLSVREATLGAVIFGVSALYFSVNLIPAFKDITWWINSGAELAFKDWVLVVLLCFAGIYAYFLAIAFALCNRRILDHLYNGSK